MKGRLIDLHMHSCYSSDGEFTPEELVEKCKRAGIEIMAISDHNCVKANACGEAAAKAAGITYIPGIEIDCTYENVNFHVLGYGIDYGSKVFEDIENNVREQSIAASRQMLHGTRKLGFQITEQDMEKVSKGSYWEGVWTGEMFAEVLLQKAEYDEHPLLLPYRALGSRGDNPYVNFYWDFYAQGKPCYAEVKYPDLDRVIQIIHDNGGLAVLAHPGMNLKSHGELLEPMIRMGLDGIEAYSSYHTPEQAAFYLQQAASHGLSVTCGSDYHGKTKPAISLGGHGGEMENLT